MLGADAPRRSGRRFREAAHPLVSLRSPLPLMVAGIGVALLVIAAVTLPPRPAAPEQQSANLSDAEALTLVAHEMRSADAAARVMSEGRTRFDDGTWYVNVGGAHFHFTQRNRIVVAEDPPAVQLQYGRSSAPDSAPPR
jgi:hypothetical protein